MCIAKTSYHNPNPDQARQMQLFVELFRYRAWKLDLRLPSNLGYNTSGGEHVNRGKATPVEDEWVLCP